MKQPINQRIRDLEQYGDCLHRLMADTQEAVADGETEVHLTNDDMFLAQALTGDSMVTAYMRIFLLTYCNIAEKNIDQFEGNFMCSPALATQMIHRIRVALDSEQI